MLLRGTRRHLTRGFLGVQRGRREALSGVNKTHLEGHGASFVSANQSGRTGTHPRANGYKDTLRGSIPTCLCGSATPFGHAVDSAHVAVETSLMPAVVPTFAGPGVGDTSHNPRG